VKSLVRKRTRERGNGLLRIADRMVGIPAIWAIGVFRGLKRDRRRSIPANPRVIGLLKASGIGDAVILSGVLRDLRSHFPKARIVLFSGLSNYAFARLLSDADSIVPLPVRKPFEALRLVRKERPEVMIDFGMWPRFESIVASLSGARWIIGVKTPGQHRHFAYDTVVEHSSEHEIRNYRNLVAPLGVVSKSGPVIRSGLDSVSPLRQPYVILHLWPGGSNAVERSWPTDRWLTVARVLTARGNTIVLSGGPDDVERTRALIEGWGGVAVSASSIAGLRAEETIVWLRHARGVISVNTGLLHLAAAVDTPTIAINGPTSGKRWGPLGRYTRCVSSPMVPEGYLNLGWERDERYKSCMEAIAPEAVLAAWDDLAAEVDGIERLAIRET
jgi:ADP-heptose:LPS heptosyltransferase